MSYRDSSAAKRTEKLECKHCNECKKDQDIENEYSRVLGKGVGVASVMTDE